jgi:phosphate transport system protein
MSRHLDEELSQLKTLLLEMGGCVEKAIEEAIQGLIKRESSRLEEVHALEKRIDDSHLKVDEACIGLLARQQPMANDLRWVVAVLKINADLERMGDQAVNIAQNAALYLEKDPIKPLVDIPKMAQSVQLMVRESLDALVRLDEKLARRVLSEDDAVDNLKDSIFRELMELMKKGGTDIEQAMRLILIARNLERLGDHATNIAEDVIYAASGRDIRHGRRED